MAVALQCLFHAGWHLHEVVGTGGMTTFLLLVASDAQQVAVLLQRRILHLGCSFSIRRHLMALQAGFLIEHPLLRDHQHMRIRLLKARPLMACVTDRIAGRLMRPEKIAVKNPAECIFIHLRLDIMTGEAGQPSACQGPADGYAGFHLLRNSTIYLMHLKACLRAGAVTPVAQSVDITACKKCRIRIANMALPAVYAGPMGIHHGFGLNRMRRRKNNQ